MMSNGTFEESQGDSRIFCIRRCVVGIASSPNTECADGDPHKCDGAPGRTYAVGEVFAARLAVAAQGYRTFMS